MKFKKDLFWNYTSLIVMAAAGLLMNAFIVYFYDSSALGIFSETYAWYLVLSQIAIWGIHMSVLKFVPEQKSNDEKGGILKTALFLGAFISGVFVVLTEVILFFIPDVPWKRSLQAAVIGLIFFSLNKVLLNYLNALSKMIGYAVFQILRYMLLIISIVVISLNQLQCEMLALTFPVTEGIVFCGLLIYIFKQYKVEGVFSKKAVKKLLLFGTKILPSNMVVEMNTKVDVICLGLFVNNTVQIGIYSFAILFSDGFYQLYITIRKIAAPKIVEWNIQGKLREYIQSVQKAAKKYLVTGTVIIYGAVLSAYTFIYKILLKEEYRAGIFYLAIICFAIAMNGKKIILGNILSQTGRPLEESKLNMITVLSNVLLNILLIPLLGTIGAAIATGLSYFIYGMLLKKAVRSRLEIDI